MRLPDRLLQDVADEQGGTGLIVDDPVDERPVEDHRQRRGRWGTSCNPQQHGGGGRLGAVLVHRNVGLVDHLVDDEWRIVGEA